MGECDDNDPAASSYFNNNNNNKIARAKSSSFQRCVSFLVSVFLEIRFQVAIDTQTFFPLSRCYHTRARTHTLISKIKFDKVKYPVLIDFFHLLFLYIKKQNSIVTKLLSVRWNVVAVTAAKINSNSNSSRDS